MPFQPGTTNRTALYYAVETTFNSIPTGANINSVRYTGGGPVFSVSTTVSEELRPDRMTADSIIVGATVEGDINIELSYASFDDLIEAALCGTWTSGILKNGTALRSFTFQKQYQDLAVPVYQNFAGCRIGGMSLSFETGSILTGSFSVMGCQATTSTTNDLGPTIVYPGQGNTPMNAVTGLTGITQDGVASTAKIRSMSMDLSNNLRGQEAIGTLGYLGIALGRLEITGEMSLYFEDQVQYQKFLDSTAFSLGFTCADPAGNSYAFLLPKVKYETGDIAVGGSDEDLMIDASWRALYDQTTDAMIQITRAP